MSELDEVGGKMGEGLLNTSEVQTRYGFVDPRAARAIMWEAGGFDRGNRMFVRASDLDRWERRQSEMQNAARSVYGPPSKKSEHKTTKSAPSSGYQRGAWRILR